MGWKWWWLFWRQGRYHENGPAVFTGCFHACHVNRCNQDMMALRAGDFNVRGYGQVFLICNFFGLCYYFARNSAAAVVLEEAEEVFGGGDGCG